MTTPDAVIVHAERHLRLVAGREGLDLEYLGSVLEATDAAIRTLGVAARVVTAAIAESSLPARPDGLGVGNVKDGV